jgi:hypothetical protein
MARPKQRLGGVGGPVAIASRYESSKLPSNFWDVAVPLAVGDTDVNVIFREVGAALTIWEGLETTMSLLYSILIESESDAAFRAYGAMASATGRRDALEHAAEVFFHKNNLPKSHAAGFKALMSNYARSAARRNDIAHGVALQANTKDVSGYFLVSAPYNSKKMIFKGIDLPLGEDAASIQAVEAWLKNPDRLLKIIKNSRYMYTAKQINNYTQKFATLIVLTMAFITDLPPHFRHRLAYSSYVKK